MIVNGDNPETWNPSGAGDQSGTAAGTAQNLHPLESDMPGGAGANLEPEQRAGRGRRSNLLIRIVISVVVLGVIAFVAMRYAPTTTSTTTTVPPSSMKILGCMDITKPGTYYLSSDVNVGIRSGPCINVMSNDVALIGNGNRLMGSGPYVETPPFTYGIYLYRVSNVSISGFVVSSFSFGIYLDNATNSILTGDNATKETVSGIYLNDSSHNTISNSIVSGVLSDQGGIALVGGSGNKLTRDAVVQNAFYGVVVNSTGTLFANDTIYSNPVDLVCGFNASQTHANQFVSSTCAVNDYCDFAKCSITNLPFDLSSVVLGHAVNSCGSIDSPGVYTLSTDLSMPDYLNMSNPLSRSEACIKIKVPNVRLDCNNHRIANSNYGIDASGAGLYNTTIENCVLLNSSDDGINADSNFYPIIRNDTIDGGVYGLYINNVSTGVVLNTTVRNSTYGVYLSGSGAVSLANFNASRNTYGVYVDKTLGITFVGGRLLDNSRADLYCSANAYDSTHNQFQNVACGVTDCNWGTSCTKRIVPPISFVPITNCYTITAPGNYSLISDIIGGDKCINIETSNVNLDCGGYVISGMPSFLGTTPGSGVYVSNESNVAITNCGASGHVYGFLIRNSSYVTLQNDSASGSSVGVLLSNVAYARLLKDRVVGSTGAAGFLLSQVRNSIINGNTAKAGANVSSGFLFNSSYNNIVSFNNATSNINYGFFFKNSNNNNVFNNSAFINNNFDYHCSPESSGLYAEQGEGVNFGSSKGACRWLIEMNPSILDQPCQAINVGQTLSLSQDLLYTYGQACITVYNGKTSANNTVINCNHHTMLATAGGTFVDVLNSSSVVVQDCFIKNFTYPIKAAGQQPIVINNTIVSSNVAIGITGIAVTYPKVFNNTILNASYGILIRNGSYGDVRNNRLFDTNISMEFSGGATYLITNNTADHGGIGMYMINTTTDTVQGNRLLNMSGYGISCTLGSTSSAAKSLNKDNGNNVCSSNNACYWMSASNQCLAH